MPAELDPLLVITGPTASGKSDVGVELAESLDTEIISADSVQVYRHFDIGSAKPPPELLNRVPHHLIDATDPDEEFNVATYRDMAGKIAKSLWAKRKIPLVVGGSGLYIRGLVSGMNLGVKISDEVEARLNAIFETEGQAGMHRRMSEADPGWAANIHPNDTYRIRRALGVFMTSGKTMSKIFAENPDKPEYDAMIVAIDPPRELLYRRIEERTGRMLNAGWRDEVKRLVQMGYTDNLKPMRTIGYRALCAELAGATTPNQTEAIIVKETKAFARRQLTWLRKTPGAIFLNVNENETAKEISNRILKLHEVQSFLARRDISF